MAGSLVKITATTVLPSSAVSSVTLTGIDSTFDVYMLLVEGLDVDSSDQDLKLRFTESGTPNTTANYDSASKVLISTTSFVDNSETNQTSADFSTNIADLEAKKFNSITYIFNANNSSEFTFYTSENTSMDSTRLLGKQGGGVFTVASAVDGVQIIGDSANIERGTLTLYGLKK